MAESKNHYLPVVVISFICGMFGALVLTAALPLAYGEYQRVTSAITLGLPLTADNDQIADARWRRLKARTFGLALNATRTEINAAEMKERDEKRKETAVELGLPPTASWDEISDEEDRQASVEILRLPDDAGQDEISLAFQLLARWDKAKELGLPPTATWAQVEAKEAELKEETRKSLAALLKLPPSATTDEIETALIWLPAHN